MLERCINDSCRTSDWSSFAVKVNIVSYDLLGSGVFMSWGILSRSSGTFSNPEMGTQYEQRVYFTGGRNKGIRNYGANRRMQSKLSWAFIGNDRRWLRSVSERLTVYLSLNLSTNHTWFPALTEPFILSHQNKAGRAGERQSPLPFNNLDNFIDKWQRPLTSDKSGKELWSLRYKIYSYKIACIKCKVARPS